MPESTTTESRMRRWSRRLVPACAIVLLVFVLLGFCGGIDARFDIFAHGRLALLECAVVGISIACLLRGWGSALICALALVVDGVPIALLWFGASEVPVGAPRLRCMLYNVRYSNPRMVEVADFLRDQKPELLAVQEVTPELHALLLANGEFVEIAKEFRRDPLAVALYRQCDAPLVVESATILRADTTPVAVGWVSAEIEWSGSRFRVVVPRILPPVKGAAVRALRAEHYAFLREIALESPALIVIGDLNSTPFSSDFRSLLSTTGLRDSAQGFGYQPSWPTFGVTKLAPIPIDHILHSSSFVTARREVLRRELGSDHFPVLAELARSR